VPKVHHSAIGTLDVEASLAFWRDGLGFSVLMDREFKGDWPSLFGGSATSLRSVFLGDAGTPESGVVELVEMAPLLGPSHPGDPAVGFFLLSLFADLDSVLPRLASLGLGGTPRLIAVGGVRLAVVHDPNGVRVELMDNPARANLAPSTSE
jgi:catechol 2,3-dioxygenase-like lactoylglutathione lyase family enzyme